MSVDRDEQLERAIGRVLKTGVIASGVCLAIGLALLYVPGAQRLATMVIDVGLVVLMATPVSRVVVSVYEYARERDWTFVILTSIVLVSLLASLIVGFFT
jgi:uncharacterized membrane protein